MAQAASISSTTQHFALARASADRLTADALLTIAAAPPDDRALQADFDACLKQEQEIAAAFGAASAGAASDKLMAAFSANNEWMDAIIGEITKMKAATYTAFALKARAVW